MAADCRPLRFATRSLEVPGGDYAGFCYRVEGTVPLPGKAELLGLPLATGNRRCLPLACAL
jgi:hypothetical protein